MSVKTFYEHVTLKHKQALRIYTYIFTRTLFCLGVV